MSTPTLHTLPTAVVGVSGGDPVGVSEAAGTWTVAQVSVGSTATLIKAATAGRRSITIVNHGTTPVYLGGSGVTTANGVLLPGTEGASLTLCHTAAVYGITASGTQTVSYSEESD